MNVVTACKPLQPPKSHRTPEQANMPAHTPRAQSVGGLHLRNRRILADQ
jgi:hypothetical protein